MKKFYVILLVCLCTIVLILALTDPIAVSVKAPEIYYTTRPGSVILFSLEKNSNVRYYFKNGNDPSSVTVYYLNRSPEDALTALKKGHVTLDDLERLGIEYGCVDKNYY